MDKPLRYWERTLRLLGLVRKARGRPAGRAKPHPLRLEHLERRELLTTDLVITGFTPEAQGRSLRVYYDVVNEGAAAFDIGICQSSDGVTPGSSLCTRRVTEAGDRSVGSHTVTVEPSFSDPQQDYYLMAVLDCNGEVQETSEANNATVFAGGAFQTGDNVVHVQGSDAADTVTTALSANVEVTCNSTTYSYAPASVSAVHVRTHGGTDNVTLAASIAKPQWCYGGPADDTATLNGSSAAETATLSPGTASVVGSGYQIDVYDCSTIDVVGGGGADTATLNDSAGTDTFEGHPTYATLTGPSFSCQADNFDTVEADSQSVYPDPATVAGRHLFYNYSAFDGNDPAANAQDDGAIAPDKSALLPGQTGAFANYSSFYRGINGIVIDIAGLPAGATLSVADFAFKYGNNNTPGSWSTVPDPPSVSVRRGAGTGGSDRVTLIWADDVVPNGNWLQVTVKGNGRTGLAADDVFYFGCATGEVGNSETDAKVNSQDVTIIRNNYTGFGTALIDNPYDLNRDRHVNSQDVTICRNHYSGFSPMLLVSVPGIGSDVAHLYDSSGADTFEGGPTYAQLSGQGFSNRANEIGRAHV